MNVLFLTLYGFSSLQEKNIYPDLLREFVKNDHQVYVISPIEKREGKKSYIVREDSATILRLQIGNIQKTNIIEKGISTLLIALQYKNAISKYFSDVKFDLVMYSTPPITLLSAIEYVKKRDGANTYLLLKDIFPQNAVDLGMMSKTGIKGILYRYFRNKEKRLYAISDRIGCMSKANVDYVKKYNPNLDPNKVEICPNSLDPIDKSVDEETRIKIRIKYGIPQDKKIFVYGGNLGKPQDIPFIIECLRKCQDIDDVFFLIIGDGTEYGVLEKFVETEKPRNLKLMKKLPRNEYDSMIGACDVGLIFLDYRFTIPNFPSRLLSYMQAKIPVVVCTDLTTDIGTIVSSNDFGWKCPSNNAKLFSELVKDIINSDTKQMGIKGYSLLCSNYSSQLSYEIIVKNVDRETTIG